MAEELIAHESELNILHLFEIGQVGILIINTEKRLSTNIKTFFEKIIHPILKFANNFFQKRTNNALVMKIYIK
jgi:hypothetical protein